MVRITPGFEVGFTPRGEPMRNPLLFCSKSGWVEKYYGLVHFTVLGPPATHTSTKLQY